MPYAVNDTNILVASRKTLKTLNKRYGFSFRKIARAYDVNVKYISDMAQHGKKPTNPDVLEKMGLKRKPKPPTPFMIARDEMAAETKQAAKCWKTK